MLQLVYCGELWHRHMRAFGWFVLICATRQVGTFRRNCISYTKETLINIDSCKLPRSVKALMVLALRIERIWFWWFGKRGGKQRTENSSIQIDNFPYEWDSSTPWNAGGLFLNTEKSTKWFILNRSQTCFFFVKKEKVYGGSCYIYLRAQANQTRQSLHYLSFRFSNRITDRHRLSNQPTS